MYLTDESKHVVSVLAMTDVLISVQSPSLVKVIFMEPNSALILSQPPGYKDYKFKHLAKDLGLVYKYVRSNGQRLSECSNDAGDEVCLEAVNAFRYSISPATLDKAIDFVKTVIYTCVLEQKGSQNVHYRRRCNDFP